MAQLTHKCGQLIVAIKRDLLFVNQPDGSILHKLTLPPIDPTKLTGQSKGGAVDNDNKDDEIVPAAEADNDHDDDHDDDDVAVNTVDLAERFKIQNITISPSATLLAITTAEDKALYTYRLAADDATTTACELLSKRESTRTASSIRFSPNSDWLLLADKTGDCLIYDCRPDNCSEPGKWLLAHFSMVLDILFTPNQRYIITCDRDEKIRVTEYPKTTVIETYCLAHTEFVAAIELLPTHPDTQLISISGDKSLILWNYLSGLQLGCVELPGPALRMAVRKLNNDTAAVCHVAVHLHESDNLLVVYEIDSKSNIRLIDAHQMADVSEVTSIMFAENGCLLLAVIVTEVETGQTIAFRKLVWTADEAVYKADKETAHKWTAAARSDLNVTNVQLNAEEIGLLFKKKFHNIHNYQQRKKRRIEEKNKNKVPSC